MYNTIKRPVSWVSKRLSERLSDLASPQVAVAKCEIHEEDLDFHCNDCHNFICSVCIKSEHKDHDWDTVKKLAKTKRLKIPERCREIRNELVEELQNVDQIRARNWKSKKAHLLEITQMEDKTIEKIRTNAEIMKQECIKNEKLKAVALTQRCETLKQRAKYITDTISHFEKHRKSMSDKTVIETDKEIDDFISEMTECTRTEFEYSCHIHEGEIAHGPCGYLLGNTIDFNTLSASSTGEFNVESCECLRIVPQNDNDVVILTGNKKTSICFYGTGGKLQRKKELSFCCRGVLLLPGGNILMANFDRKKIDKADALLNISDFITTAPLMPIALCTSTCGFLLSLVDEYSYKTNKESERIVQEMNLAGEILAKHKYLKDDESFMFTVPSSLVQNINKDVCVVNRIGETKGMIIIIRTRSSAKQSLIYEGFSTEKDFDPADVVCDSKGFIIVTDTSNSFVHLLDTNGKFMKYLITEKNNVSLPNVIGIYNSSLWIAAGAKGVIVIYCYTNNVGDKDII